MRDPLRDLVEPASPGEVRHRSASYRVGVVTGMDPLRVQVENEDTQVGSTPVSLVHTWTGAKVYLQSYAGMLVVVGNVVGSNILPSGVDLNNYIHPGVYYQPSNAAVGSNYPDGRAGVLEVFQEGTHTLPLGQYDQIYQRYTTYVGDAWHRRHYSSSWNAWRALDVDSGWKYPTFQNGWSNYSGYEVARYRKRNGIVYVNGLVKDGSIGTIFTLESGFRPPARLIMSGLSASNTGVGRFDIHTDGRIEAQTGVNPNWLSINTHFAAVAD